MTENRPDQTAVIISQLDRLGTEQVNSATTQIDRADAAEICRLINDEDRRVPELVADAIPAIATIAESFAGTLRGGGRIFYVGAGTSGRLGVLDAAECPPTFGTSPDQIIGLIAGGYQTLVASAEGVEDDEATARAHLNEQRLSSRDLVIGIAASTRTPYTIAAIQHADTLGCATAMILCNAPVVPLPTRTMVVCIPVGPEVITGSTRMKSGTAQKMVLNMISTTAMILLGKTYGNRMVDLVARSAKLTARSQKMLMELVGCTREEAEQLLINSRGSVKIALVMNQKSVDYAAAVALLTKADGHLWKVIRLQH